MSIRSLRTFGLVSAIGGGFALMVLLCLGVALVRSIAPVSHAAAEVRLVATPSAMSVAADRSKSGTFLAPAGALTSTGTLPSTASPAPTGILPSAENPVPAGTLPSAESPALTGTLPLTDTPGPSSTAADISPTTDTEDPSPTPTYTPSPDSTPAPVVIRGTTGYVTDNGEQHVVGEVLNGTSGSIWFAKVSGTFYDVAGQVVITDSTYTLLDVVGAGEVAPFDLALLEPPAPIDHYDLEIEYATIDLPPLRVDIAGHQGSVSDTGSYHVVGEVENQNGFTVNFIKVVVTFYNAQNEVVRIDFSNTALDMLSPGQKAPFDVALLDPPADMDHYAVKAQAYQ
jgi:hypothetical protein